MLEFDDNIQLFGHHPELARSNDFNAWLNKHGMSVWHETHPDEQSRQTVVVQSANRKAIYAALLKIQISEEAIAENVAQRATFDLVSETTALPEVSALRGLRDRLHFDSTNILSVRPVIDFEAAPPTLGWEIDIDDAGTISRFRVSHDNEIHEMGKTPFPKHEGQKRPMIEESGPPMPTDDPQAENELHHLAKYRSIAQSWTQGANTVAEKARRIWLNTQQKMAYDASIQYIDVFTWSDLLVIDQLGWRGICDEWAVVQVTMLRALGIPAVIKWLAWNKPDGSGVAHGCLEYLDGGTWRHMDALWHALDNRAVYRQNAGAKNVTVMDANYPLDSRSTAPAWGVPDPTGDLKLHPYLDFIINPTYPGNARPGYSY
jgi:hypothetical protein